MQFSQKVRCLENEQLVVIFFGIRKCLYTEITQIESVGSGPGPKILDPTGSKHTTVKKSFKESQHFYVQIIDKLYPVNPVKICRLFRVPVAEKQQKNREQVDG